MTDEEFLLALPERDEMMAALVGVTGEPQIVHDLYPGICDELAGQRRMPCGICLALHFAILDFTVRVPGVMVSVLYWLVPDFIRAITPDGTLQVQALADWEETMRRVRTGR